MCQLKLNQLYLNSLFFLAFLFATNYTSGQDTLAPTVFEASQIRHGYTLDPVLLANKLIEGKSSEKEKFDAIFTWVVTNISYDYSSYKSAKAFSSIRTAKRILRRRKGICTDYAHLMDTLCDVAGIPNVTVTGYTKEMNFDLNDTLYFDNHAWNAVKLNGLWYVYDPTWCSGYSTYDYTRIGKWRLKMIQKILSKAKEETIHFTIRKEKKNKYCGIPESEILGSKTITTLGWLRWQMIRIINHCKYRVKEKYVSTANSKYYLANPEEFSKNHFPNDPTWSLTQRIPDESAFSTDSAYFFGHLPEGMSTKREGRFCLDCDTYYYKDQVGRENTTFSRSLKSNPSNRFVPANYNLFMAQTVVKKAFEEEDSLTKMNLIDSTLRYIDTCKLELRNAKTANRIEYRFQTRKNKEKKDLLLAENKLHRKHSENAFKETNRRRVKVNSLLLKASSYEKLGRQHTDKFEDAFYKIKPSKVVKGEVADKISAELAAARQQSDSLTREIAVIQSNFVAHATLLWGNLLVEDTYLRPVTNAFNYDNQLRFFGLMDNYDYRIMEVRKDLNNYEQQFLATIDTNILLLSDTFYNEFMQMNDLIKKRNALDLKSVKWVIALKNSGLITSDSIIAFREQASKRVQNDACWNADNAALIDEIITNYLFFLKNTRYYAKVIRENSRLEEKRYSIHNNHLVRNRNRNNHAIDSNANIASDMRRALVTYRSSYLRKLRKEQTGEK